MRSQPCRRRSATRRKFISTFQRGLAAKIKPLAADPLHIVTEEAKIYDDLNVCCELGEPIPRLINLQKST